MVSHVKGHLKISSFSHGKAARKHAFKMQEIPLQMSLFLKVRPPAPSPHHTKSLIFTISYSTEQAQNW